MTQKKAAPKKAVAKKAAAKPETTKAAVKTAVKKVAAKAAPKAAVKAAVKKVATKKAIVKTATEKKTVVKKAAVKKVEKIVVKAPVVKKVATKKAAAKTAVKKVAPKKNDVTALYPESVVMSARVLFALRAEAVQLLDLRGLSDVADWYLVATCTSEAQMQAILNTLSKDLKAAKIPTVGVEYRAGVQWAVLDVGEIMVHLFEENKRKEFALDLLWRDGKVVELKADDFVSAKAKVAQSDDFV